MHLFRDKHDRDLQVFNVDQMLDFAEQYSKALLEEAAEKATIIEIYDGEIVDEYTSTFIDGVDYEINKESILSLIPKEK